MNNQNPAVNNLPEGAYGKFIGFLKKINKKVGIIACSLTMISYFILLLIGTGLLRTEFNFVLHALIPAIISKVFVFVWVLYFALCNNYDKTSTYFARNLLAFIIVNMIITFLDFEMIFFFLVQSITSTLLLILTTLLINQRRFAIRSKKIAGGMRIINTILAMCMGVFVILIVTSFVTEYVYLFIATIVSQIFMIIAIIAVEDVEKKFQQALVAGENDSEEAEYSD